MLAELEAYSPLPSEILPGDLTRKDVVDARDIGYAMAGRWLEGRVEGGKLRKLDAIDPVTHRRCTIYRKVET